jgi:hypothetical protein
MTTEIEDLLELIEAKKREIEHYVGVLERSQGSRWYDQGRRHMVALQAELNALQLASASEIL